MGVGGRYRENDHSGRVMVAKCQGGNGPSEDNNTEIYKNSKYKNSPYYKAAKLWDILPRTIRNSSTLGELKQHLKVFYPRYVDDFYLT